MTPADPLDLKNKLVFPGAEGHKKGLCSHDYHWKPSCDPEESRLADKRDKDRRGERQSTWDLDDDVQPILPLNSL